MNLLIRSGLIGGAIGGETMVLVVLVNTLLLRDFARENFSGTQPSLVLGWMIVYPLLIILIFEMGGIFSAWLSPNHIFTEKEGLIPGAIAGITIGIILEIMWIANILSLAARTAARVPGFFLGQENSLIVVGLLIVLVIMGGILSAFGSYVFSRQLNKKSGRCCGIVKEGGDQSR
jgi:hypothetical protein